MYTVSNCYRALGILFLLVVAGCSSPTENQRQGSPTGDSPPTFSVGGGVRGLVGKGLVLRDEKTGLEVRPDTDGAFTIDTGLTQGAEFKVVVAAQPNNPLQSCSVFGGAGAIVNSDVTDIGVNCATPGSGTSLDQTFGSGGRVIDRAADGATAVGIQLDGKIVVAAESKVVRFNTDGSLDQSFGNGGHADFIFPDVPNAISNLPQGLAIQGDGQIVVVGFSESGSDALDRFVVARYNTDGTLDANFGTGGREIVDFGARSARGRGVALLGDGRMVLAGEATLGANNLDSADVVVTRLNDKGEPDDTFGNESQTHTHFDGGSVQVHGIGLQGDNGVVVVGQVAPVRREGIDLALVSLTRDGAPDTLFGRQGGVPGQLQTDLGTVNTELRANAMVINEGGQIVIAGEADANGTTQCLLVRVNDQGGPGAPILTSFTTQSDRSTAIALTQDGNEVVVGRTALFGSSDFGILLFSRVGGLIPGFGSGGKQTVDFTGGLDGAGAVAVQPDGKIVVAGFAHDGTATVLGLVRIVP